ncbi:MAG: hypothetical protein PHQ12_02230 [Chthoniobacteraceae bacterium]|nr:hypothetical protein [Chthoniobacteraceae bacterium]
MDPITAATANALRAATPAMDAAAPAQNGAASAEPEKTAEAARQFEAILVRQFLGESMKPLLDGGPAGKVYGYLLTDSLADTITKGGGMGISHILQAQLTQ